MQLNDEVVTECQGCSIKMIVTVSELEKDYSVVCRQCLKVNVFDVEKYKLQRQQLIDKVFRDQPENPENN